MACSIARTLAVAGEPWTPLVVRDLMVGIRRFDQLQAELGISRKVLTERLRHLEQHGVVERRPYSDRPPRYDYLLTEKGRELADLLLALTAWGDRWTAGDAGPPVLLRHQRCGQLTHAELRCACCGEPLRSDEVDFLPGPGAAPAATDRHANQSS
jgi:DNA-binding HxlR family transcriptional regulator